MNTYHLVPVLFESGLIDFALGTPNLLTTGAIAISLVELDESMRFVLATSLDIAAAAISFSEVCAFVYSLASSLAVEIAESTSDC